MQNFHHQMRTRTPMSLLVYKLVTKGAEGADRICIYKLICSVLLPCYSNSYNPVQISSEARIHTYTRRIGLDVADTSPL